MRMKPRHPAGAILLIAIIAAVFAYGVMAYKHGVMDSLDE